MALPVRHRRGVPAQRERYATRDPFTEIDELWNRMTTLFDQVAPDFVSGDGTSWVPAVEAEEKDDAYVVKAELPGLTREDVDIDVHDRELVIKGRTAAEDADEESQTMLRRRSGSFYYRAALPIDVDTEHIKAAMRHGVLTVRLPKREKEATRKVEISEG